MNEEIMYINVLITSLQKKISILEDIQRETERHTQLLQKDDTSIDDMDSIFDKKEKLIEKLNETDKGFETIYSRVQGVLTSQPSKFKEQVKQLQELIKQITELSVNLQAQEHRNKEYMENFIIKQKKEIRDMKSNNKAALQYYQNMANQHRGQSYFLDQKE